jgi:NADPH-dependent F420 reductase
MSDTLPTLSIIGGTGALGGGLAARWASAGYPVVLGSRSSEKAVHAAQKIDTGNNAPPVRGTDNKLAAAQGDIVIITVPFANHRAILQEISSVIAGKIVVDATVPLMPPKVGTVQLPTAGSAASLTQDALGERADVVAAFHNVAADKLRNPGLIDCDVLVCGNKKAARQTVIKLVEGLGMRGLHAGPIANSAAAEALTSVIITINRIYKADGAGIRITGDLTAPDTGSS